MIRVKNCTFYCCYLLQSVPKPGSFYIGSTPDPYRRLRQHNGELKQGARRTKPEARRPWRMICIVSGFQSRISALQFEHAWQHAYQTRHIAPDQRITQKRTSNRGIDKHIGNIRLLANAPAFSTSPLVVHLFEKSAKDVWEKNKFKIDCRGVTVEYDLRTSEDEPIGGGTSLAHLRRLAVSSNNSTVADASPMKKLDNSDYLEKSLEAVGDIEELTAVCPHCYHKTPLTVLAKTFLQESRSSGLIPKEGSCPSCKGGNVWHEIASNARRIKHRQQDIVSESEE